MASQSILRFQDYDLNAGHMPPSSPSLLHLLNNFAHQLSSHHYYPRFDIDEHDQAYELYGDLPGAQQANLKIATIDDHTIEISGSTTHYGVEKTSALPRESAKALAKGASDPLIPITHREASDPQPHSAVPGMPPQEAHANDNAQPGINDASDGGELTKTHGHQEKAAETKVKRLMTERQSGTFHRIFPFTNSIKEKEVTASFHDGVLHITVPKGPAPVKNHIEVYWGGAMF